MGGDDVGPTLGAGGRAVVTAEQVWDALAEIPDPEIPVISLVDLGVVKGVGSRRARCASTSRRPSWAAPALEAMQRAMEAKIRGARRSADVDVRLDDSWSTDDITAEGREKLRAAGFAPPTPRPAGTIELVQLQRGFRCPYCGSTEHEAREPLRPDAVPLDPLLRGLPPAVRAVQDDLVRRYVSS